MQKISSISVISISILLNFSNFATFGKVAKFEKYQTVDSLPNSQKEFFIEVTGKTQKPSMKNIPDLQDSLEALSFENQVLKNNLKRCMEGAKK